MHIDRQIASLLGIAFPILTAWLLLRATKEREQDAAPDRKVLRFTKSILGWWYVCISLFAVGFSSDLLLGKVSEAERLSFWLTFSGFAALFVLGTWFLLRHRVEYDPREIVIYWPTGKSRKIAWADVLGVEFKKGTGVVIEVRSSKRQVITSHLPGIADFLEASRARISKRG